MDINTVKETVIQTGRVVGRVISKRSPEILMVVGTGCVIGSAVMTGKATLRAQDILEKKRVVEDQIKMIHNGDIDLPEETEYSDEDYKKDIVINNVNMVKGLAKEYWPAVSLMVLGISCLLGAHGIMQKRNAALVGAYKLCEETFKEYRNRVVEELGIEKDEQFYYGFTEETVSKKVEGENGKKKTVKEKVKFMPNTPTRYARYFDEVSEHWSKSPDQNKFFLECVQNMLNDRLHAVGTVTLNEVYDALGIERCEDGQMVGWHYDSKMTNSETGIYEGDGDGYIDFHIYNGLKEANRNFVNGYEPSILLDFNVDGYVADKF